jgi:hypothetical protein
MKNPNYRGKIGKKKPILRCVLTKTNARMGRPFLYVNIHHPIFNKVGIDLMDGYEIIDSESEEKCKK